MSATRRRVATVTAALTATLVLPFAAFADNVVDARVQTDDTRVTESAFSFVELEDEPVREVNVASAYASCERCEAYGIAFQVVLAEDATDVRPLNLAGSATEECTSCVAATFARQWVRVSSAEPELTDRGEDRLDAVAAAVRALEVRNDLDLAQLEAEVERLEAEIDSILATELRYDDDDDDDDEDDSED